MTSTFSGTGKRSRGVIHLQDGPALGITACGRGDRAVNMEAAWLVSCKRCRRILDRLKETPEATLRFNADRRLHKYPPR